MFYLEFRWIEDFGKHLQSNEIREAFVLIRGLKDLPEDREFSAAVFTSRINDYIALCAQQYSNDRQPNEFEKLKERLERLGIEVKWGCWTGTPPPNLSGIEML